MADRVDSQGGATGQTLTVSEVARALALSEDTVRRRVQSGELPSIRIGSGPRAPIRIAREDLVDALTRWSAGDV